MVGTLTVHLAAIHLDADDVYCCDAHGVIDRIAVEYFRRHSLEFSKRYRGQQKGP
jgi:hypothetical protein